MAVAHSIFNLGGWVQLFWTAFDPMFTVVPLKVALGWHKFDFWAFKKIIMMYKWLPKWKNCNLFHPNICKESLLSRSCANLKNNGKCSKGYNLQNTKYQPNVTRPAMPLFNSHSNQAAQFQPAPIGACGPWRGEGGAPLKQPKLFNSHLLH